ncbi:hypothetical protein DAPPUDRAFT_330953 [Daphnia pulex]|uniref:SNF2 N-terminal domain-containing protein n=1 Tax=Daphnia pulex TaxID=6669 RepID=E9HL32_DAPPU|nr:hypothetical protein DAPPUDRAFT_330953 [Daphnia pulex]|eukprot:EFX67533.1 hypothetical protein DAPPUDRAFT_330953 [Daphnia pulex]
MNTRHKGFLKTYLLGTQSEFNKTYVKPIEKGQDEKLDELHEKLEDSVDRFDDAELKKFLPAKYEYFVLVKLSPLQIKIYQYYLENLAKNTGRRKGKRLFAACQELQRVWTHPSSDPNCCNLLSRRADSTNQIF